MRTAIISDIHGNLEAFEAVLKAIDARKVDQIICLGDILGYGPNPLECVDLVAARCVWSLMGNHDYAVLYEPTNFNNVAKQAAYWTRECLDEAAEQDVESGNRRLDFLNRIKPRVRFEDLYTCVHGSVRKPINEYVFDTDVVDDPRKMREIFDRIENRCLVGHTHVPGIFQWTEEDGADFTASAHLPNPESDDESDEVHLDPNADTAMGLPSLDENTDPTADGDPLLVGVHEFDEREKCIVNPGSVGQPRDGDERASFAILDTNQSPHVVEFYRLRYDVDAVIAKINAIPELDNWLGDRLAVGR